jgi:hypothetical protein
MDPAKTEHAIKNSYHIVVANFVFPASDCVAIKSFAAEMQKRTLKRELPPGHGWMWDDVKKNGSIETKHVIDMAVYTKNRSMRLPLCCKKKAPYVPLLRISGDPLKDDLLLRSAEANEEEEGIERLLPFLVCRSAVDLPLALSLYAFGVEVAAVPKTKKLARPDAAAKTTGSSVEVRMPFSISDVSKLLSNKGDNVIIIIECIEGQGPAHA